MLYAIPFTSTFKWNLRQTCNQLATNLHITKGSRREPAPTERNSYDKGIILQHPSARQESLLKSKSVCFGPVICIFSANMQVIRSDKTCQSDVKTMSKRCYNTLYARKKVLLFAGPFSVTFITSEGSIEEFSPRRSIQAHRGKCNKKEPPHDRRPVLMHLIIYGQRKMRNAQVFRAL